MPTPPTTRPPPSRAAPPRSASPPAFAGAGHDTEHQRYSQLSPAGETLYLAGGGVFAERFAGLGGGGVQWTNYLIIGGRLVGVHIQKADETTATRYFHADHLGSISVITNETGEVVPGGRLSYDAWGKRRWPNGEPDPAGAITSEASRGFTGHEHLDSVGLIHMNGRVYDPLLARFGTPDPMTENPFSTQGWNRYSYVGNSPVNFTDPSGYCFMGCFWQPVFRAIGNFFRQNWRAILQIAVTGACQVATGFTGGPACAALGSFVAGITSGNLGQAIRGAIIAYATAFAFKAVGDITGHETVLGSADHLANMAGHALVGCASSVAGGGRCGPGALTGALGSFAGGLMRGQGFAFSLVARSVLGGLASVAGGGNFANGAVLGAFSYLFNDCGGPKGHCSRLVREMIGYTNVDPIMGPWATYHGYATDRIWICGGDDPGCSIANIRTSMLATQVPGYDGTVADGGIYPVRLLGVYIGDVRIYDDGLTISNVTELGHILYYGYVTRSIEIEGDNIHIRTVGEGGNINGAPVAVANGIGGPILFKQQGLLTREYYNQNFAGR